MSDIQSKKTILRIENISKYYGSVNALNNVNFSIYEDEVVGLVGDNGAGKSTLVKIISGNFPPSKGDIYLEEKKVNLKSPSHARSLGIETVYQDLALCEDLDTVSNLYIGREICKNILGFQVLQKKDMERKTLEIISKIGTDFPSIHNEVKFLSGGQRQAVALGRFVEWGDKLILLDEPTAALGVRETNHVLELVAKTRKEKGVSMILISHNMQHVFQIADRIIVLRHGEIVGIREKAKTTPEEIVSMITGAIYVNQDKITSPQ